MEVHHPGHVLMAFAVRERLEARAASLSIVAQRRPEVERLLRDLGMTADFYPARKPGMGGAISNLRQGWGAVSRAISDNRPDAVISVAGVYSAGPARRAGVWNALLTDTESATLSHVLAYPFADLILHPRAFRIDRDRAAFLSERKRITYQGHHEAAYLRSPGFRARIEGLEAPGKSFAFIRAIAWRAYHEAGGSAAGWESLLRILSSKHDLEPFASIEEDGPSELEACRFKGSAIVYHRYLSRASLVVTEGATTATEATYYGRPVIFINRQLYGTVGEAVNEGRVLHAENLDKAVSILDEIDVMEWQSRLDAMGPRRGENPLDALFGASR